MKHHTRRAIAFIAGNFHSKNTSGHVYDFAFSKHFAFSGEVSKSNIALYDHTEGVHIGGSLPGVYHHGNGSHITININKTDFNGYEHDTGTHFSGTINGNSINIYDHQESKHFNYSV